MGTLDLDTYMDVWFAACAGPDARAQLLSRFSRGQLESSCLASGLRVASKLTKAEVVDKLLSEGMAAPICANGGVSIAQAQLAPSGTYTGAVSLRRTLGPGFALTLLGESDEFLVEQDAHARSPAPSPSPSAPNVAGPGGEPGGTAQATPGQAEAALPGPPVDAPAMPTLPTEAFLAVKEDLEALEARNILLFSRPDLSEAAGSLEGYRVVVAIPEELEADGEDGVTDCLVQGLHVGLVGPRMGSDHDADACAPGCCQSHEWHTVYFPSAPRGRVPPSSKRRMLELQVDLATHLQVTDLSRLPAMGVAELSDMWILAKPPRHGHHA